MSKFEKACEMALNDWLATIPDEVPEAEYTDKHEKWLKILFNKMRDNRYHTFTTKTVKLILIAAVISAFFLTAFAVPSSREFIIENFDIFSTYRISETTNNSVNGEITVGYIPEGFEFVGNDINSKYVFYDYKDSNGNTITITKFASSMKVDLNIEIVESETILIGDNTYYYYLSENETVYAVWNRNDYIYQINGNISKEEILKIAQDIK